VELAEYLDQKFESVSIYSGDLSFPGPDTVWFDVDPSSEGWLVIRRLQAFLDRYGRICALRPYRERSNAVTTPHGLQHPLETLELESAKDHLRKACLNYAERFLRATATERPFNGNDTNRWAEYAENALCEEVLSVVRELESKRSASRLSKAHYQVGHH
jgi:hypothetical protein